MTAIPGSGGPSRSRPGRLRRRTLGSSLLGLTLTTGFASAGDGQNLGLVVRDGSVGSGALEVGPGCDPLGLPADYLITPELGEQRGGNLLHSFDRFGIGTGETATFTGPDSVDNVISRVTGGWPSDIDGTLRSTIPDADLYLLNPAGLLFGRNAQLDVQGSFHASTAEALRFADGTELGSRQRNPPPILSVATPAGFGFLGPEAARIEVAGSTLLNPAGVSLAAGSVELVGARIQTNASGSIDGGSISILASERIRATSGDDGAPTALSASSTTAGDAGDVALEAPVVDLLNGTSLSSNAFGSGVAGDVSILASESATLSGKSLSGASSTVQVVTNQGRGDGGSIQIAAPAVELSEAALLASTIGSTGRGGEIRIEAGEIRMTRSLVSSTSEPAVVGGSGLVGDAGRVAIEASGGVTLVDSIVETNAVRTAGDAGEISVQARSLGLRGGSQLSSRSVLAESEGRIVIEVTDGVSVVDSEIDARTTSFLGDDAAQAGRVDVWARSVTLERGRIGGSVSLRASESVRLSGSDPKGRIASSISASSVSTALAGSISIEVPLLELADGAFVSSSAFGDGRGGDIVIRSPDRVILSGADAAGGPSSILAVTDQGMGHAGSILLETGFLQLDGANIVTSTIDSPGDAGAIRLDVNTIEMKDSALETSSVGMPRGAEVGRAGRIEINAADTIRLVSSRISAEAQNSFGGSIAINGDRIATGAGHQLLAIKRADQSPGFLVHLIDSEITTRVGRGEGDGGNLLIDPVFVVLEDSTLTASAEGDGDGGSILIVADAVFSNRPLDQALNASSARGTQGAVEVRSPEVDLSRIIPLQANVLDTGDMIPERCAARRGGARAATFVVEGRSGLPPSPDGLLASGSAPTGEAIQERPPRPLQ